MDPFTDVLGPARGGGQRAQDGEGPPVSDKELAALADCLGDHGMHQLELVLRQMDALLDAGPYDPTVFLRSDEEESGFRYPLQTFWLHASNETVQAVDTLLKMFAGCLFGSVHETARGAALMYMMSVPDSPLDESELRLCRQPWLRGLTASVPASARANAARTYLQQEHALGLADLVQNTGLSSETVVRMVAAPAGSNA